MECHGDSWRFGWWSVMKIGGDAWRSVESMGVSMHTCTHGLMDT
jgi:hypothetical protein